MFVFIQYQFEKLSVDKPVIGQCGPTYLIVIGKISISNIIVIGKIHYRLNSTHFAMNGGTGNGAFYRY